MKTLAGLLIGGLLIGGCGGSMDPNQDDSAVASIVQELGSAKSSARAADPMVRKVDPKADKQAAPQAQIVFSSEMSTGFPTGQTTFSLNELLDLCVYVWFSGSFAPHTLEVKFFTPDGYLYVSQNLEIDENVINTVQGGWGAWTSLPVGGTQITSHGLSGTWRVETVLDGTTMASSSFLLQ